MKWVYENFGQSKYQQYKNSPERCSIKKGVLENSQNSQKNTCAKVSFFIKLQTSALKLKKKLWHKCFPVNFEKFLRTSFLQNTSVRLFPKILIQIHKSVTDRKEIANIFYNFFSAIAGKTQSSTKFKLNFRKTYAH